MASPSGQGRQRRPSQHDDASKGAGGSRHAPVSPSTRQTRNETSYQSTRKDSINTSGRKAAPIVCDGVSISPEEVEGAIIKANERKTSPIYRRIRRVLAFPTAHDTLGQDVAVILVARPKFPRVGLQTLHDALREVKLDRAKWPMLIVYMDAIPEKGGKPLRSRLQQRLHLPVISGNTNYLARHWEAKSPPKDASFMRGIDRRQCQVSQKVLMRKINRILPNNFETLLRKDTRNGGYEAYLAPETSLGSLRSMREDWEGDIRHYMTNNMHGYMIPVKIHLLSGPLPRAEDGAVDEEQLRGLRLEIESNSDSSFRHSIREHIKAAFAEALSCDKDDITSGTNFFRQGGDRTQAEKLIRRLRADFNVDLTHAVMAKDPTVEAVAKQIESTLSDNAENSAFEDHHPLMYDPTRWWLMTVQLLPLVIMYPARRSAQWTLQLWLLSRTRFWEDTAAFSGRLLNLILSIFGAWAMVTAIFPLIGILSKWIIIGRYKEGSYPMWGPYHTRWWMVQKITSLCGMGFFGINSHGKNLYCRLMGAKIGKGVQLNNVVLGEWDLLDIREGANLTKCNCRPFAAERNSTMYLAPIIIGERATIGVFSIVAPGTEVLPDTFLGVNSSSWEQRDSIDSFSDTCPAGERIREANWTLSVLLNYSLYGLGWCIALTPWLGAQVPSLWKRPQGSSTPLRVILDWFQGNPQVAFHYVAVMGRVLITPLLFFGFAIGFRLLSIAIWGELPTDCAKVKGEFQSWRATFIKTLYPPGQLTELNELLGPHPEARARVLRLLGAKVGKRIIWPDIGPAISDFHLMVIGNDVTIGSDCQFMTTDESNSGVITICDGAVVADHACLLPGVTVGERTTIGFGTLTKKGKQYPSDRTFVGARNGDVAHSDSLAHRLWDGGAEKNGAVDARDEGEDDERKNSDVTLVDLADLASRMEKGEAGDWKTRRKDSQDKPPRRSEQRKRSEDTPLYKARFLRQAPYLVLPPMALMGVSMFMTVFTEFYWNVPALSAAKLSARIFTDRCTGIDSRYDAPVIYLLNFSCTVILTAAFAIMAIGFIIFMKRSLIGKFQPGTYDWDKSSYCQRWQLYLSVDKLIKHCYIDDGGIISLLTGTHWLVLYYRVLGAKIGKDCALFASGNPDMMITETDLVEIGDRVVVDNAAIVPHLDRRGSILLDRIKIGNRCVLRAGSNLLSGSVMKDDSCLMEHTLILPGETIEEGWNMHRRPGERFLGNRKGFIPGQKR